MKNESGAAIMAFEPVYVAAAVGDTIRFVPTDAGHNAEPIPTILPSGVVAPAGEIDKECVLKLSKAGLYGIKCRPHYPYGMVALIKAGNGAPPNAEAANAAASRLPTAAKKRMLALLAQVK